MKRRLSDSEDEEASASKWMQGERQTELERHSNIYDDNRSNAFKGRLPFHKIKGNNTNFPYYRQPREIGFFSLDIERKFLDDKSQLKFYVAPANERDVYFDLKEGFNFMIQKDDSVKEYIDDLLRWILTHKESFILRDEKGDLPTDSIFDSLNTDFVCWRGLLTKLLCTPFERRDGWLIAVVLFGGTYYLCEFETEEKKAEKAKTTKRQQEMCYWGWKFEQYLVSNSPKVPPKTNIAVNNCEAYCTVVRSRLTSHSLVFAGEVDCLNPKSKEACKYVELKTSREIDTRKQDENFKRFKLIKWWAQSFLPGVPEIIAGFRDDSGVVHRLKTYKTMDIPTLVKDIRDPWDAAVCFNFLDRFLSFVKKCVQDDNHRNVYLFSWKPNEDVICEEMGSKSEFSFLPEWYINKIFLQP